MDSVYNDILRWCNNGFESRDAKFYGWIDEALATLEQTPEVKKARALAKTGPTLISSRFAYPHIADVVRTLKANALAKAAS